MITVKKTANSACDTTEPVNPRFFLFLFEYDADSNPSSPEPSNLIIVTQNEVVSKNSKLEKIFDYANEYFSSLSNPYFLAALASLVAVFAV